MRCTIAAFEQECNREQQGRTLRRCPYIRKDGELDNSFDVVVDRILVVLKRCWRNEEKEL